MMHERYILMPCICQTWKEQNLALKEVSEIDRDTDYIILKIKCLYCHKVRRIKMDITYYYETFLVHERE